MKILQLTNKVPYPDKDGGAIATLNLTRGLAGAGHQVTVLAMNTLKHNIRYDEIPEEIKQIANFKLVTVPAKISPFKALLNLLFSNQPYNAVRFISKVFENDLFKILRETEFDIIQLEGLYLCPYIPVIREHTKAKIAYRAHNIEHEIWQRTAALSKGLKKLYVNNLAERIRNFELKWLNQYDFLVPITERDGAMLQHLGNTKPVHILPTGININTLNTDTSNIEFPSLFHIGSLEWSPNQEGLLWFLKNCWPQISSEFPGLKFYIAGRNAPQWLVAKLNLPGVVFLGEVENAHDFINSKAIMVVPLLSGSGMRIKIIEGMALGKAIISTPIGAEGIGVTHNENILIAENASALVQNALRLAGDRAFCSVLGQNARNFILENFDNLALAENLAQFYQKQLA